MTKATGNKPDMSLKHDYEEVSIDDTMAPHLAELEGYPILIRSVLFNDQGAMVSVRLVSGAADEWHTFFILGIAVIEQLKNIQKYLSTHSGKVVRCVLIKRLSKNTNSEYWYLEGDK